MFLLQVSEYELFNDGQLSKKNSCQNSQIPLFSSSIAPHGAGANRFCPVKQVKTTIKQTTSEEPDEV